MGKLKAVSFEDLEVWQLARELRKSIYNCTSTFPSLERYLLALQLRKSAISVTANIAEGFGRFHYQENIQFCRQARGSLNELLDHIITSHDEGYISTEDFKGLYDLARKTIMVLNGYIRSLQKLKTS